MTTWQIVVLFVGIFLLVVALEINDQRRLRKQKKYVEKVAEMLKKLEAREAADEIKRLELEAAELEKSRKLFVCFSDENKDRLELITLMTRASSPEQVIYDAWALYQSIVEERKNGRTVCIFDESARTIQPLRSELLDGVRKKIEG